MHFSVIAQIDSLFTALTNSDNPTPVELKDVEEQLAEFKGSLLKGFDSDIDKWKRLQKYSIHNIMKRVSLILMGLSVSCICWYLYELFLESV